MDQKIVTIFNKTILRFASEICETFPNLANDAKVKNIRNTLETTIILTPNIPIKLFYDSVVLKYQKQLDDKNENFFLSFEAKNGNHPIDLVKAVYQQASDENKEIVWKYVDTLRLLTTQYHQLVENKAQNKP